MSDDYIGKRYRIIRKIGEGGMGSVYQAVDERLARAVAIKRLNILDTSPTMVEQIVARFEREAKAMAQFRHPNIVNVFDYGQDESGLYLVIEYMPGGTLRERMGKPMPVKEAAGLLLPIANALSYVHEQGMVHRDIKPANILFDVHNNPMLTDFGVVKLIEQSGATLTTAGTGVGTPAYMAPEQMSKDLTIALTSMRWVSSSMNWSPARNLTKATPRCRPCICMPPRRCLTHVCLCQACRRRPATC